MKFDYTNGKTAKYGVTVYSWNVNDINYFHYLKDAKAFFEKLKNKEYEPDTIISIYDLKKDIRKSYMRF